MGNIKWDSFQGSGAYQDLFASLLRKGATKADAGETLFGSRALEYMIAQAYDMEYVPNKARTLFPLLGGVASGAESFTYKQYDMRGEAKVVENYADDFPSNEVLMTEFSQKIVSLGASYGYSVQDLRAAQMANVPLDMMKARAARESVERKIESMAAIGSSSHGITGFTNAANIASETVTDGTWTAPEVDDILADINKMQLKIFEGTKGIHTGNTLLLGTKAYGLLATTARSVTYTDDSIMTYVLKQSPWLKSIEHWAALDTAGSGGAERIMLWDRNPNVAQLVLPQDFEQMPPEAKGMKFSVACHARCGGVQVRYPKAICYMDGTSA